MEIKILSADLMLGVRDTFLSEAAAVPEEAGSARPSGLLSEAETERAFAYAVAYVKGALGRFLTDFSPFYADNRKKPLYDIKACIRATTRTPIDAQSLATIVSEALKESMLASIFKPLVDETSEAHAKTAADIITNLEGILLSKKPPMPRV